WLEPELFVEHAPCLLVGGERVRLATGTVERLHQQRPQPLAQRVLGDQRLEFLHELGPSAELELGPDPLFGRGESPLAQLRDLLLREVLELEILERPPTPQRERGTKQLDTIAGAGRTRLRDEPVELRNVEVLRIDAEDV